MKEEYRDACLLALVVCSSSRLSVISQIYRGKIKCYAMFRKMLI